jgi:MprA protease rhombosortase-interaction domain-containing protein
MTGRSLFKFLSGCLFTLTLAAVIVAGLSQTASALVTYDADTTLTTGVYDRFYVDNGATLDVPAGETATIASGDRYPTSYANAADNGAGLPSTIDVAGTLDFDTGHAFGAGDSTGNDGSSINILSGGVINVAGHYGGARSDHILNIETGGTLNLTKQGVNTGGTNYSLGLWVAWGGFTDPSDFVTGVVNQQSGSVVNIQDPLGNGDDEAGLMLTRSNSFDENVATYNMFGGMLTAPNILQGNPNSTADFNFHGGTITILGKDRTDILNDPWFNDLSPGAVATFDGTDTTIVGIPEPASALLLIIAGLAGFAVRRR